MFGMWLFSSVFCLAFVVTAILKYAKVVTSVKVHDVVSITLEMALTISLSGSQANMV